MKTALVRQRIAQLRAINWAFADQFIVSGNNFVTMYILARYLDPVSFGVFSLSYTAILMVISFQNALFHRPHNVIGAKLDDTEFRSFNSAMAFLNVLCAIVIGSVTGLVGLIGRVFVPGFPSKLLVVMGLSVIPWMTQEFMRRAMYTRIDSKSAFLNDLVAYGLQLILVIALVIRGGITTELAIASIGVSSMVAVALGLAQYRHAFQARLSKRAVVRCWVESWNIGRWLVASSLVRWFGNDGHGWVVAGMLGTDTFGRYRAAILLLNVLNPIRQTVMNYFPSRVSWAYKSQGTVGLSRWVRRSLAICVLPTLLIIAPMVLYPDVVLQLAYNSKYAATDAAWILALSAVAQLIGTIRIPLDIGLLAMERSRGVFVSNVVGMLLLLTVGILLIYKLQIAGLLISQITIGLITLFVTSYVYLKASSQERT